ncbi:hypothetical protein SNEBB_008581 [Seison nebaliae]|nr:hypothetical protein SNEBB_008581 [Seison nebaliae]
MSSKKKLKKVERSRLPVEDVRKEIIEKFHQNDMLIIEGDTGCGKTTQIPQYIDQEVNEHLFSSISSTTRKRKKRSDFKRIIVTQPRRVAAISIAKRVSYEQNKQLGEEIGYAVRFDECRSKTTRLEFQTDGLLVREEVLSKQKNLQRYSVIIVDEAHERSIQTDFLLSILKRSIMNRKSSDGNKLKIIIMSATLDSNLFHTYFQNDQLKIDKIRIKGKLFPIQTIYLTPTQIPSQIPKTSILPDGKKKVVSQALLRERLLATMKPTVKIEEEKMMIDRVTCSIRIINKIHMESSDSIEEKGILIFLTGRDEIERGVKWTEKLNETNKLKYRLRPFPLYAQLSCDEQMEAIESINKNERKVVFATNVAETSLTIKERNLELFKIQLISKAQAIQRMGRCGRERKGICYRVYDEKTFHKLPNNQISPISLCSNDYLVLQLISMKENPLNFDYIESPNEKSLFTSLVQLILLGFVTCIIDEQMVNNQSIHFFQSDIVTDSDINFLRKIKSFKLTENGKLAYLLPVEPKHASSILLAYEANVLKEMISIISVFSVDNIQKKVFHNDSNELEVIGKFNEPEGDHFTLKRILEEYKKIRNNKNKESYQWCRQYNLNRRNLEFALNVEKQLSDSCLDIFKNTYLKQQTRPLHRSEINKRLRQCLLQSFVFNTAEYQTTNKYRLTNRNCLARIHPTSVFRQCRPLCVCYNEYVESNNNVMPFIKDMIVIEKDWLREALQKIKKNGENAISIKFDQTGKNSME